MRVSRKKNMTGPAKSNPTKRFMQFLEEVASNPDLEDRVATIEPDDTASLVELATANGFVFTVEEFQRAIKEVNSMSEELSKAELEAVSARKLPGKKKPPNLIIHRNSKPNFE